MQLLGAAAQGLGFAHHVLVPRLFGAATYGLYTGGLAIIELLSRLGIFAVDRGMYRFVAGHRAAGEHELERRAIGTGLRLTALGSVLLMAAVLAGAEPIAALFRKPEIGPFLRWLAPTIPAMGLVVVFVSIALARRAPQVNLLARGIGEPLFLVGLGVVAWAVRGSPESLAIANALAFTCTLLVAVRLVRKVLGPGELTRALRAEPHPEVARFVAPLALLDVLTALRQRVDLLLLVAFLPLESVAYYQASSTLGSIGTQIRVAIDGVAAPLVAESLHARDRARLEATLERLARFVATLSLPALATLGVLRRDLLALFGEGFVAAGSVLIFHLVGHALNGVIGITGHVITMGGHARLLIAIQSLAIVVNAVLLTSLTPTLGLLGAGISFFAATSIAVFGNAIGAYVFERVHPLSRSLLKPALATLGLVALESVVVATVGSAALRVPLAIVAGLLAYGISFVAMGLEPDEREALGKLLRKLRETRRRR